MSTKINIGSRLGTSTPFIKELMQNINTGEMKIPQFQRKFIWQKEQALKLLDSISSNYPIGSLLLWKTSNKLAAERNIGEFKLPETDDLTPTDYVLDGQQRLTVIYSTLGADEDDEGFQAVYNLEKERFEESSGTFHQTKFPLRIMYNTTKLLNFRAGLVSSPDSEILQTKLDNLIDVITNYKIPVVTLKGLTVEEVCPIFERINSSGTKLSTYDLMVAATWSESFDLNDKTSEVATFLSHKGFGDINGNTVLKCLSAVKYNGIKKDQVLALRTLSKEEMDDLVTNTKSALLQTVDLLKTEFKIYSWDFLPYEAMAIILTYIFANKKTLDLAAVKRVRTWFWRSGVSERYRGASESFVSKDLIAIQEYVIEEKEPTKSFGEVPTKKSFVNLTFRSNNSRSRALIILLSMRNPRNITNGALIDTENALSHYNKKQFHHIYPKAYLKREKIDGEHNSLANFCMLAASENNIISDANPNDYLSQLVVELGKEADIIFKSNYLPLPSQTDYKTLEYETFLDLRAEMILNDMKKLINGEVL